MADKLGDDFKLYRNTATYATPTWSEVTQADDLGLDHGINAVEIQKRGRGVISAKQGKRNPELTCSIVYDSADSHVTQFETDSTAGGTLHMAVADGDITTTGTSYWHAEMIISGFSEGLNIGDAAKYEMAMKIASATTNDPARATV